MRYLWALMLCAAPVAAQDVDKTVEVRVQAAPQNPVKLLQADQGNTENIRGAKLSPDGKMLALYGVDSGDPNLPDRETRGVLQIWDLATRQKMRDLVGHKDWMQRVFWSHDGQKLASQSQDGQILLWDALSGKQLFALTKTRELPSFGAPSTATPAQQVQQLINVFERPQLIGFAPDDSQIYALGGHLVLPAAIQKGLQDVLAGRAKPHAAAATKKTDINLPDHVFGSLQMWNARTGIAGAFQDFGAPGYYRLGGALSADGKSFLVSSAPLAKSKYNNGHVERRDLKTGALQKATLGLRISIAEIGSKNQIYFSLFSDDGRLALLTGGEENSRAQIWDMTSPKPLGVIADKQANFGRAFFVADNTKLLVGGRSGDILFFDVQSKELERRLSGGHWGEIGTLDLTPDGKTLISVGSQDSVVQLWDLTKMAGATLQARTLAHDHNSPPHFAPDGSFWIGYGTQNYDNEQRGNSIYTRGESGKTIELQHFSAEGKEIETISLPEEFIVQGVVFSPDFKFAAAGLGTMVESPMWKGAGAGVWDIAQKKLLWHLPGNVSSTDALAFAPDGNHLATGRNDGVVQLWDMQTGELVRQLWKSESIITALTFGADGQTLNVGTIGGLVKVLAVTDGAMRDEWNEDFAPNAIMFSPDGKYVLSGGMIHIGYNPIGFKVALRDAQTKKLLHEWADDKGAPDEIEITQRGAKDKGTRYFGGLAFSPDSKLLAFAHFGNLNRTDRAQTEIWEIATNTRVGVIPDRAAAQAPTFARDGKSVITTDGNWIKSWDLADVLAQNAK